MTDVAVVQTLVGEAVAQALVATQQNEIMRARRADRLRSTITMCSWRNSCDRTGRSGITCAGWPSPPLQERDLGTIRARRSFYGQLGACDELEGVGVDEKVTVRDVQCGELDVRWQVDQVLQLRPGGAVGRSSTTTCRACLRVGTPRARLFGQMRRAIPLLTFTDVNNTSIFYFLF